MAWHLWQAVFKVPMLLACSVINFSSAGIGEDPLRFEDSDCTVWMYGERARRISETAIEKTASIHGHISKIRTVRRSVRINGLNFIRFPPIYFVLIVVSIRFNG